MSSIERQTELNVDLFALCILVVGEITPLTVDTRRLEAFHMKCQQHVARIQYRQIGEACCILPVKQCVNFKSAVYVYRALHNTATQYLVEDCQCQLVSNPGRRRLRSVDVDTCTVQHTRVKKAPWRQELFGCWSAAVEQFISGVAPATR